jgi:hypothetical protein
VNISILPDDVLLEVFAYVAMPQEGEYEVSKGPNFEDSWRTLVHVCKRWRYIVFASPRRLNLRLLCTNRRPVKKLLEIWPPLPTYIFAYHHSPLLPLPSANNLMAALKQHNRVCGIFLDGAPNLLLGRSVAMKPFPALTELGLLSSHEEAPVLPDSFLGGSAPCLRTVWLEGISSPGIGTLLLSTTDLVNLYLTDIPRSGYISPETMVVSLSMLTRLKQISLEFRSPRSWAGRENRHVPPLTRAVLPALTSLQFQGDSNYLEDMISRIDAPLLESMDITFFSQPVFHTPQLRRFIRRTDQFKAPDRASIQFCNNDVTIELFQGRLLNISCKTSDWQISSIAQLYDSALFPLPTLKSLEIHNHRTYWQGNIGDIQLLEFLRLFAYVEDLVLSAISFRLVAPALDELTDEMVTEVLPALQNMILEGPHSLKTVNKAIGKFIAKRRLLGCPVTVYHRDSEYQDYRRLRAPGGW